MRAPMEAYKQLILQDTNADPVFGVHKISEKTNHRWKDGFLAGYETGRREALLEAAEVVPPQMIAIRDELRRMAKELE